MKYAVYMYIINIQINISLTIARHQRTKLDTFLNFHLYHIVGINFMLYSLDTQSFSFVNSLIDHQWISKGRTTNSVSLFITGERQ